MLKAVIFDLDGVITDTAEYHFVAWKKLAEKIGITITEELNENLKGVDREESLRRILALSDQDREFSDFEKAELAKEKNDYYVSLIDQITPKDVLPGITELLSDLKAKKIKIGLASASKNAPKILLKLGLNRCFDTIVNPAKLIKGKPDPEIFLQACKQLEVEPAEAIGIEDAFSGVHSINDAKLISIGVGDPNVLSEADYVVSDTGKLNYTLLVSIFERNRPASS